MMASKQVEYLVDIMHLAAPVIHQWRETLENNHTYILRERKVWGLLPGLKILQV